MRLTIAATAIVVLAMAVLGQSVAQDRPAQLEALPQRDRQIIINWLQRDCSISASAEELNRLRSIPAAAVEEVLVEAYRQGPPAELERSYSSASVSAFDSRAEVLAREGSRLLSADDAARLQAVDRDSYIRRRLDSARLNYRTNAVTGLGLVKARGALPLLNEIASEAGNPMRDAARNALQEISSSGAR
jgi:hypothetical protein